MLEEEELKSSILVVLANKQDLGGALNYQEISKALGLHDDDIAGRHFSITGCSAITGDGLESGFQWIVNDISSRIFMMA